MTPSSCTALSVEPSASPDPLYALRDICREMASAVDEERRAGGETAILLGAGSRLSTCGAGSSYRFALDEAVAVDPGDPVVVGLGHREFDGTIEQVSETHVDILFAEDHASCIPSGATLVVNPAWLLLRLRKRILDAFEVGVYAPSHFDLSGALRAVGIGEIEIAPIGATPEYENEMRPLNDEQAHAVAIAFRSPLTVIPAPAGTGKTHTLGALVQAFHAAGLRTLIAAPTNVAVDLTMLQACHRLAAKDGLREGNVLRVGDDTGQELREQFGADVVLEDVIARIRPKLRQQIAAQSALVDNAAAALNVVQQGTLGDRSENQVARELVDARLKLRGLQQEAREFGRTLTAEARVVGATLAHVFLDRHLGRFDLVLVDEISAAMPPAVFVAAGLARTHVVLAGDPFQLAARSTRRARIARGWRPMFFSASAWCERCRKTRTCHTSRHFMNSVGAPMPFATCSVRCGTGHRFAPREPSPTASGSDTT